jgi:hypothetical protein
MAHAQKHLDRAALPGAASMSPTPPKIAISTISNLVRAVASAETASIVRICATESPPLFP